MPALLPHDAQGINDVLGSSPIMKNQLELRARQVSEAYPEYASPQDFSPWHLSLWRFATVRPLVYVRRDAVEQARAFFNRHPELTVQGLKASQQQLSHAVFSLLRPGTSWQKEEGLSLDEPTHLVEFDSTWHPEYQLYCEHIFNHLIRVPLFVLGNPTSKPYLRTGFPLPKRVDVLRSNNLGTLTQGYSRIVRNAISHGSTSFELTQIVYTNRDVEERLFAADFGRLFDDLVDSCHSVIVALLLFLCDNQALVEVEGLHNLPLGLRFLFIDAFTSHKNLELVSMGESGTAHGRKQLNIACRIGSRSRSVQLLEGMRVCWNVSVFGGEDYDRFAVSFDCGASVAATMFLDGQRLARAVDSNEPLDRCASEILETSLLWFDASRIATRMYSWSAIAAPGWELAKRQIIDDWRKHGLRIPASDYTIRHVTNSSVESIRRIEAHVTLRPHTSITQESLRRVVVHATRRLRRRRIRSLDVGRERGLPRCPNYVWVRLCGRDARIRTLASYGWRNKNLLLWAEWFSPGRNRGPIRVKKPHLVTNGIRIEYNPNLVQALPRSTDESDCSTNPGA